MHDTPYTRPREALPGRAVVLTVAIAVGLLGLVIVVALLGWRLDPIDRAAREREVLRNAEIATDLAWLDLVLAGAWRAVPLLLVLSGSAVALGVAWRRWGSLEAVRAHYVIQATKAQHGPVPATLTYSPHWSSRSNVEGLPAELPALPLGLPTAPSIGELAAQGWAPSRERVLLGYTHAGPLYGSIDALLSTAIAGRPGQGKSTLLRGVYWQVVRLGGGVGILDPHGSILDDVRGAGAQFVASAGHELDQAAALLVEELERRLEAYRGGRRDFAPMLTLADELPVLSLASRPAVDAIGRVILEGRKAGMYALVSGQGLPADRMGGRLVRDALSSRYIFRTSAEEARRCGLAGDAARLVLDLRPGVAILDGPCDPTPIAVPNCTAADLQQLGAPAAPAGGEHSRGFGFRPAPRMASAEASGKPAGSHREVIAEMVSSAPGSAPTDPEAARIIALFLSGVDIADIVREVYQVSGGRAYQERRAHVERLLRDAFGRSA